jgi:hypothetical protein
MLEDSGLSRGFASGTLSVFAPKKSVIVDMVMVQLLTVILTLGIIMLTGANSLASDTMAYLVAGMFGSFFMLGSVYARISQI